MLITINVIALFRFIKLFIHILWFFKAWTNITYPEKIFLTSVFKFLIISQKVAWSEFICRLKNFLMAPWVNVVFFSNKNLVKYNSSNEETSSFSFRSMEVHESFSQHKRFLSWLDRRKESYLSRNEFTFLYSYRVGIFVDP